MALALPLPRPRTGADSAPKAAVAPRWLQAMVEAHGLRLCRHGAHCAEQRGSGRDHAVALLDGVVAALPSGQQAAILRIDIDDLDRVNEGISLGAGDLVLEAVAQRVAGVVGDPRQVTRIAGAAFVAALHDAETLGPEAALAHRIRREVGEPVLAQGHVIQPTVSIGVALASPDSDAERLLQAVSLAVRRARDLGGDRVEYAQDGWAQRARERLELEESLRRAIAADEVRAWYQPIVDFADERVVGYEALSRWIDRSGRTLSPATFIPVAEAAGLVPEIDFLVLAQSLGLLTRIPSDQFVSVNVSPLSLSRPDFIRRASTLLHATAVDLSRLHLEVTETALPGDLDAVRSAMLQLGMGGARWYFDDFGTGFSSLTNLGELPVDGLKLDMSFTRGIDAGDETSLRLAQGLLALARSLDLDTVAEGVESAAVAAILREQGWSRGQGWLYGKAEPVLAA